LSCFKGVSLKTLGVCAHGVDVRMWCMCMVCGVYVYAMICDLKGTNHDPEV